jgi:hypothetical protein
MSAVFDSLKIQNWMIIAVMIVALGNAYERLGSGFRNQDTIR